MRLFSLLSFVLLAACQSISPSLGTVGSADWMEKIDRELAISDGQGHGPDHGSQEWCDAVYFKTYGERPVTPTSCDQEWMQDIDGAMR